MSNGGYLPIEGIVPLATRLIRSRAKGRYKWCLSWTDHLARNMRIHDVSSTRFVMLMMIPRQSTGADPKVRDRTPAGRANKSIHYNICYFGGQRLLICGESMVRLLFELKLCTKRILINNPPNSLLELNKP